jgi:hypothetical protein
MRRRACATAGSAPRARLPDRPTREDRASRSARPRGGARGRRRGQTSTRRSASISTPWAVNRPTPFDLAQCGPGRVVVEGAQAIEVKRCRRILMWAQCAQQNIMARVAATWIPKPHMNVRYVDADTRDEGSESVRSPEPRTTRSPHARPRVEACPSADRKGATTPSPVFIRRSCGG